MSKESEQTLALAHSLIEKVKSTQFENGVGIVIFIAEEKGKSIAIRGGRKLSLTRDSIRSLSQELHRTGVQLVDITDKERKIAEVSTN